MNVLRAQTCDYAQQFLNYLQSHTFLAAIDMPTRVYNNPGGGGTPLREANGDVPLDGVAFSRLE